MLQDKLGTCDNNRPAGGDCPYCGKPKIADKREHLLPRAMAQGNRRWDIWVCDPCNAAKGKLEQSLVIWNEWNIDDGEFDKRVKKWARDENLDGDALAVKSLEFLELYLTYRGETLSFHTEANGKTRLLLSNHLMRLWAPWAHNIASGLYYLQENKVLDSGTGFVEFVAIERMEAVDTWPKSPTKNRMREAMQALETGKGKRVGDGQAKIHCSTINKGFIVDWGDWYFFLRLASLQKPRCVRSRVLTTQRSVVVPGREWDIVWSSA